MIASVAMVGAQNASPTGKQRHRDAQAAVGAEFHHDAGEQHRGGGRRGDVAGRRPRVKGKHAREHREAKEDEGEHPNLFVAREMGRGLREIAEAEALTAGRGVGPEQTGEDERAARERIEHELHRAVFAVGGAPVRDEEIFRHDRDLIEDEERERIGAEEHAVDAADQREVERERIRPRVPRCSTRTECPRPPRGPVSTISVRLMPSAAR